MYEPFELPSLEKIEQMEKQRSQAIEALEISDHSVKCQRCAQDIAIPTVGNLKKRRHNDRAAVLQRRIQYIENYRWGNHGNGNAS